MKDYSELKSENIFLWFCLAFQAGVINACGFIFCERFVTHTTGFATHFGVELVRKNFMDAAGMLTVPIFFLGGAMMASYFIDLPQRRGFSPRYFVPLLFMIGATVCALFLARTDSGSETFDAGKDYFLMVLLCFASGVQNGMINNGRDRHVRTTHLTGITTDLAVGLTRLLFYYSHREDDSSKKHSRAELLFCTARGGTIFSFVFGSFIATIFLIKWGWLGFLLPVITSVAIAARILLGREEIT